VILGVFKFFMAFLRATTSMVCPSPGSWVMSVLYPLPPPSCPGGHLRETAKSRLPYFTSYHLSFSDTLFCPSFHLSHYVFYFCFDFFSFLFLYPPPRCCMLLHYNPLLPHFYIYYIGVCFHFHVWFYFISIFTYSLTPKSFHQAPHPSYIPINNAHL